MDVMIPCSGSATDLPVQTPSFTPLFHTVDSLHNLTHISVYFAKVD